MRWPGYTIAGLDAPFVRGQSEMTPEARAAALAELRPALLRRARRYRSDPAAAEDLVQEALLRVWLRLAHDPPITHLKAYVVTTLRRLAQRDRAMEEELTENRVPTVAELGPDRVAARDVLTAVGRLPRDQAVLLVGLAVEGKSYAELARTHRVPIGTVMSRVSRGRARLRDALNLPEDRPVSALLGRR